MNRFKLHKISVIIILCLCFFTLNIDAQQLKLGNHPTNINKAAVLELESGNQGLRLTRVSDTSAVNKVIQSLPTQARKDSTNGMIVFQVKDSSLYLRTGGYWEKLAFSDSLRVVMDSLNHLSYWSLKGNGGTNPPTDFIGTIDKQPLVFKTNGNERLRLSTKGIIETKNSYKSVMVGDDVIPNPTGDVHGVFIGYKAGNSNDAHHDNVFVGYQAGYHATGDSNILIGTNAGKQVSNDNNVIIGSNAGNSTTGGQQNVFIGSHSAINNTTGWKNIAYWISYQSRYYSLAEYGCRV